MIWALDLQQIYVCRSAKECHSQRCNRDCWLPREAYIWNGGNGQTLKPITIFISISHRNAIVGKSDESSLSHPHYPITSRRVGGPAGDESKCSIYIPPPDQGVRSVSSPELTPVFLSSIDSLKGSSREFSDLKPRLLVSSLVICTVQRETGFHACIRLYVHDTATANVHSKESGLSLAVAQKQEMKPS